MKTVRKTRKKNLEENTCAVIHYGDRKSYLLEAVRPVCGRRVFFVSNHEYICATVNKREQNTPEYYIMLRGGGYAPLNQRFNEFLCGDIIHISLLSAPVLSWKINKHLKTYTEVPGKAASFSGTFLLYPACRIFPTDVPPGESVGLPDYRIKKRRTKGRLLSVLLTSKILVTYERMLYFVMERGYMAKSPVHVVYPRMLLADCLCAEAGERKSAGRRRRIRHRR
jgi:hypothetical protein